MSDARTAILAVRDELCQVVLERREAVDLMMAALVSKANMALLGPPGVAKSYQVRELFARLTGVRQFDYLLTRFTEPNEIFGPMDVRELMNGRYARVMDHSLATANVAFLDEIFKANSSILNALLTILNEGYFHMDGQLYTAALQHCFGASNEMPEDMEVLGALWDRFALRYVVSPVASDETREELWRRQTIGASATLTLDQIAVAQAEAAAVAVGPDVQAAALQIYHALRKESVLISDRMWCGAIKLVRARAWLAGCATAGPQHLDILAHSWWDLPGNRPQVQKAVFSVANPLHLKAIKLEDTARDIYAQAPELEVPDFTRRMEPALRQLSDIAVQLKDDIAKAPAETTGRAEDALQVVQDWHHQLAERMLKSMGRLGLAGK